jgi:hypothetical protein
MHSIHANTHIPHALGTHACAHHTHTRPNNPNFPNITGQFGIRIENIVITVVKLVNHGKTFLGFETVTLVPICTKLLDLLVQRGSIEGPIEGP